ncbi:TIGR03915 family putative DNA repair protein [Maribacter sp. 2304DJ31-5]|uniref:TIGR03915 family putative DNA repair protein n=1 Tax=Maribacter sp. 2304DJ31-5 TaxID=3386273 RepID=UPI0039BC316C
MKNTKTLIYDGSFNGFLTAVFIAFDEKIDVVDIQKNSQNQNGLFSETETIFTHIEKAKCVWNAIRNKSYPAITAIYFAFLSETRGIEPMLFGYIQKLMSGNDKNLANPADDTVLYISKLMRKVSREKRHMEASIRFRSTKDDVYFANIAPDFDVLPLISKHFRNRYKNQQWLIYDTKRQYGIFYNLEYIEIISLDLSETHENRTQNNKTNVPREYGHQNLWGYYFQNAAIKSCITRKLHRQHTPKQYGKHLSESKEAV